MALESLKGIEKVGEHEIYRNEYNLHFGGYYISINESMNTMAFKIQNGAVKENGVNGCQVDTVIEAAKLIIEGLNKKFPCRENSMAITKLDECLMWLELRTKNRIKQGIEGYSK